MGKKILSFVLVMVMVFLVGCSQDGTTNKQIEQNEYNTVKPTLETIESTASPTANEVVIEPTESPSVTQATITVTPTHVPNIDNTQKPSTPESTVTVKPTATTTAKATASATSKPTVTQTSTTVSVPTANVTAVLNTIAPSVKPTATVTVKPTIKPTVTPTKAPTAKPTVKPTAAPTATPTLEPYNDEKAQYWVDFAEDYGVSIGLQVDNAKEYGEYIMEHWEIELGKEQISNWSDGTTTVEIYYTWQEVVRGFSSWDNPITMNAYAKYIEENITDRLSRYKSRGVKSVWIWYEKDTGFFASPNTYKLYVGYAY